MVEQKSTLVGTFHETKATLPPSFDPLQCLSMLKAGIPLQKVLQNSSPDETFELIPPSKLVEEKESKKSGEGWELALPLLKNMARTMFNADRPYRCKLGWYTTFDTSAAGAVNNPYSTTLLSSVSEWTSISALFDECFVHDMILHFQPFNSGGGGETPATGTTGGTFTTSSVSNGKTCGGLVSVCLYNGASSYSSAVNMLANPTRRFHQSNQPFKIAWRNNVRFDPRGPAMSSGTTEAWQGWTLLTNIGNYGGSVHIRAANDEVFGDGAHAFRFGNFAILFDVSFRARA